LFGKYLGSLVVPSENVLQFLRFGVNPVQMAKPTPVQKFANRSQSAVGQPFPSLVLPALPAKLRAIDPAGADEWLKKVNELFEDWLGKVNTVNSNLAGVVATKH
jgi:hypothetical protein